MAAFAMGATAETCAPFLAKLGLWYMTGEPVWMAAEGLAFMAKQRARCPQASWRP